jgi:hypothetical protein
MSKPKEENPILKYLWIKQPVDEIKVKIEKPKTNENSN